MDQRTRLTGESKLNSLKWHEDVLVSLRGLRSRAAQSEDKKLQKFNDWIRDLLNKSVGRREVPESGNNASVDRMPPVSGEPPRVVFNLYEESDNEAELPIGHGVTRKFGSGECI